MYQGTCITAHCFSIGKADLECSSVNFKFMRLCKTAIGLTRFRVAMVLRRVVAVQLVLQRGFALLIVKHCAGS
jgi:hypothetical protein